MKRYYRRRPRRGLDPEEFTTILTCLIVLFLVLVLMGL